MLVERIYETIAEINRQGTTILLVEQNANFALEVSKRGYVLETGTVALADKSANAAGQPRGPEGIPGRMTVYSPSSAQRRCGCSTPGWGRRSSPPTSPSARATAERCGLATGLLLSVVGAVIWLLVRPAADSRWKLQGPFGSGGKTVAEARAERDGAAGDG